MTKTALKTASVLAFERKLDPSDALMYAGKWEERDSYTNWPAITVKEKSVRGTISNRMKGSAPDPMKFNAQIEKPNLQTIDMAALPADSDTLKVRFTLRVLGGISTPSACNNIDYEARLQEVVKGYVCEQGMQTLAWRYACNLANGRFLWRNRVGAESVEVQVKQIQQGEPAKSWTFDAQTLSLRSFDTSAMDNKTQESLKALANVIADGLAGERYTLLEITAFVRLGDGQEVFPSQELILERNRGDKSRELYKVDDIAGIHSQKLGNAIRTIDDWYPQTEASAGLGPIAAEPYGSVTTRGMACRQPKQKEDFYSLLDNWLLKDKVPSVENQHFVMAILIRGGVFGEAG